MTWLFMYAVEEDEYRRALTACASGDLEHKAKPTIVLPEHPVDGQTIAFVARRGVLWLMRYDAASGLPAPRETL